MDVKPAALNLPPWYRPNMLEVGLHCLFLGTLYRTIGSNLMSPIPTVAYFTGALLLILGAIQQFERRVQRYVPMYIRVGQYLTGIALLFSLVTTFTMEASVRDRVYALIPYGFLILTICGVGEQDWARCLRTFRIHAALSVLVFLVVLAEFVSHGAQVIGDRTALIKTASQFGTGEGFSSPIVLMRYLLYPYILLFVLLPTGSNTDKIVGLANFVAMLAWALIGQFRSALTLGLGFTLVFAVFAWLRSRSLTGRQRNLFLAVPLALVGIISFLAVTPSGNDQSPVGMLVNKTIDRFSVSGSEAASSDNGRFQDASEFLEAQTPETVLFGMGAVEWVSRRGLVLHIGHIKYLMAGGIALVLGVFLLVYIPVWSALFTSRNLMILAPAIVVVQQSIIALTVPSLDGPHPVFAMLFLCAGYCWKSKALARRQARLHAYELPPLPEPRRRTVPTV